MNPRSHTHIVCFVSLNIHMENFDILNMFGLGGQSNSLREKL